MVQKFQEHLKESRGPVCGLMVYSMLKMPLIHPCTSLCFRGLGECRCLDKGTMMNMGTVFHMWLVHLAVFGSLKPSTLSHVCPTLHLEVLELDTGPTCHWLVWRVSLPPYFCITDSVPKEDRSRASLGDCLSHCSIAVKRHHDKGNFYKRERVIGGMLLFRGLVHDLHGRKQAGIALEW